MRKIIMLALAAAATTVPAMAQAQSREEIRQDRRDVREERRELEEARRYGDRRDVREEREELRDARRELREDRADRRRYVAPYRDWRYNRVPVGTRLRPGFYGSRYTITNVNQYRVRPAGRYQRWIRYGNDLVLVNTRNGRVLQVFHNRY